jgi:hypothetical protein
MIGPLMRQDGSRSRRRSAATPSSGGRPRRLPLGSRRVEPRLPTRLELHDLGWAQHLPRAACRNPNEVQLHLASPFSL